MRKILFLRLFIILAGAVGCQREVEFLPSFTPSVNLEADFQNPPDYARPRVFWWWLEGNVSRASILSDLTAMKRAGLMGGIVFDAACGAGDFYGQRTEKTPQGLTYMSDEWRRMFVYACQVADSLGLELSLSITSGWNDGGPWVTPEYGAKKLVSSEITVEGGRKISEKLPVPAGLLKDPVTGVPFFKPLTALAIRLTQNSDSIKPLENYPLKAVRSIAIPKTPNNAIGYNWPLLVEDEPSPDGDCHARLQDVVDVSGKIDSAGHLSWDAPEGKWLVMRFGYTGTGARVSTHSPGGGGLAIDYMSAVATDFQYAHTAAIAIDDVRRANLHSLKYLHDDSWEMGAANWTEGFEKAFRKAHGYDMLPYLPVLAGRIIESRDASNRFLRDFRRTIADLIWEKHYQRLRDLAHRDGVGIHPESGGPHPAPIDALKNEGLNDIPMGEFWIRASTHRIAPADRLFVKQPASAAHIYGHRFVQAEGPTSIGPQWEEDFAYMKPTLDRVYCEGLNRVIFHTFSMSPHEAGKPGNEYFAGTHFNPNVTWWEQVPAFVEWNSRVSFMLAQGLFVGDVCYYYGDNVPNQVPFKYIHSDLGEGYDYDVCNTEVILERMSVRDSMIVLPDGMSYRALVLPQHNAVPEKVIRKVMQMKKEGATVIDLRNDSIVTRDVLQAKGIQPDFSYLSPNPNVILDYIHRSVDFTDIYYVVNRTDQPAYSNLEFRVNGKIPELWNPETGKIIECPSYKFRSGQTALSLLLEPFGSTFVVFRKPVPDTNTISESTESFGNSISEMQFLCEMFQRGDTLWNVSMSVDTLLITAPWEVSFDAKWGGPVEPVRFDKLMLWNESDDERIKYYSGTAIYKTSFTVPSGTGRALSLLHLGEMYNIAEVSVNGKPLGVWWQPPFIKDVTAALKAGENTLEIKVVNLWPNRLIGDEFLPPEKRYTRTNIKKFKKDSPLRKSGLAGPVKIVMIKEEMR
ncbi:MAG: hypothetical protein LBR06_00870 [Bacteroidales bacterium]|jgi:hypothetical protein|nr:hypothetical protein [Bacteroidales bacterium]